MIIKITYKLTALLLTFILLANNINNVIIVTDFVINQDFIAKTLCIQKEEQKGCNGKCQLKKELTESNSKQNSNNTIPEQNRIRLDLFVVNSITNSDNSSENLDKILKSQITFSIEQSTISKFYDIDTPPPNLS
ncbi:hypothetical protein [Winogradskyella sp.]|jgi:hypothetical protein|uniref:hypothetical protein n=1 Tax=Winogradskyella sp. TaxID=1883156 RepID=UPI0025E03C17|nr:hypothetical protein [Winogradskyella sp.]